MGCVRARALWSGSKPTQTGSRREHEKTPRRSGELQLTGLTRTGVDRVTAQPAKQNTVLEVKWKPYDPGQQDGAFHNGGETRLVEPVTPCASSFMLQL